MCDNNVVTTTLTSDPEAQAQYRIADWLLPELSARFDKLAKRAAKIGVPAPTFSVVGHDTVEQDGEIREYALVTVSGEAPSYDGWSMVAVIDRDVEEAPDGPHVVHVLNGYELDEQWRWAADYCDYCAETLNRTHPQGRKTLVVLEREGVRKTVGTTCLKDFLGHTAPTAIAGWMETLSSLNDLLAGFADEDEWGGGGGGGEVRWLPGYYLAWVARSIREDGWVSRSTAREYGSLASADSAVTDMKNWRERRTNRQSIPLVDAPPTDQDKELAEAALDWAGEIEVGYDTNDYLANVAAVAAKSGWRSRDLGIGASIITAYQREQEWEIRRRQRAQDLSGSEYLGAVKDKIEFAGTVMFTRSIEGRYGVTLLIKILTDDGNVITWFASNGGPVVPVYSDDALTVVAGSRGIDQGDRVTGKGTIKGLEEYEGVKQTVITRAKLEVQHS